MTNSAIRKDIHKAIDTIKDDSFLKAVHVIISDKMEQEEDYTLPGKPMSISTLKKRVKAAREQVKRGHYTTQKNLEKEAAKW